MRIITDTPWGYCRYNCRCNGRFVSGFTDYQVKNMTKKQIMENQIECPACAAAEEAAAAPVAGCPSCSDKHTDRSEEAKKALLTRLKRIEGQVRGLQGMVEKDAYCPDILIQVSAVTSALNSFSKQLLESHIRGCVRRDIANGDEATIEELCQLLQRLMK